MNTIQITGRLTADPQQRTAGELQVCDLRVAVPRRRGRDGEDRGAVFVDVTTFGALAKVSGRYLAKGRRVAVNGSATPNELAEHFGESPQNVSKHLKTLAQAGLVKRRKDGSSAIHTIRDVTITRIVDDASALALRAG